MPAPPPSPRSALRRGIALALTGWPFALIAACGLDVSGSLQLIGENTGDASIETGPVRDGSTRDVFADSMRDSDSNVNDAQNLPDADAEAGTDAAVDSPVDPPGDSAVEAAEAGMICSGPGTVVAFAGHCYVFTITATPLATARTDCQTRGGHLVNITSAGEQTAIETNMPSNDAWIGLVNLDGGAQGDPNAFYWDNGEARGAYSNWNTNEPSGSGGCVRMKKPGGSGGKWEDRSCTESNISICEIP